MSQKELGRKLGVSQQMIGQWETDKPNPKMQTIKRLSDALGVPLMEIIGDNYKIYSDFVRAASKKAIKARESIHNTRKETEFNTKSLSTNEDDRLKLYNIAKRMELLTAFDSLNYQGKVAAVERVTDLIEIERYTKPDEPPEE